MRSDGQCSSPYMSQARGRVAKAGEALRQTAQKRSRRGVTSDFSRQKEGWLLSKQPATVITGVRPLRPVHGLDKGGMAVYVFPGRTLYVLLERFLSLLLHVTSGRFVRNQLSSRPVQSLSTGTFSQTSYEIKPFPDLRN